MVFVKLNIISDMRFIKLWLFKIHFFGESIFLDRFAGQGVLNKDPTVWLDGARPPPIKSNYKFGEDIILQTQSLRTFLPFYFGHYVYPVQVVAGIRTLKLGIICQLF